jgi:CRISPR/Cas system-associated exonuclease Cas4 (RecB family)
MEKCEMLKDLQKLAELNAPKKSWPTYDGKELNRSEFLTSSEVAQCLRKSFYEKNSTVRAFDNNGYAERGHAIEAWLVDKLRNLPRSTVNLLYMGEDQRSFYNADLGLAGTPDGLLQFPNGGEYVLVEIKSIDPRTNKNALPKRKHLYQVQQNMMLVANCLDIVIEKAVLLYIDASDVFDQKEFILDYDEDMVNEVHDRAATLWAAHDAEDLPAEGLVTGDCDNCKFTGQCSGLISRMKALETAGASPFSGPPADLLDEGEAKLVQKWLDLYYADKETTPKLEAMADQVKAIAIAKGGTLSVDGKMVRVTTMAGRTGADKDAITDLAEKAKVDVASLYKTGKPFLTMTVK